MTSVDKNSPSSGELPAPAAPNAGGLAAPSARVPAKAPPSIRDMLGSEDTWVGYTIGDRYVLDAIVGEGGMGRVYLAHHKIIDKKVAIKILHPDLAKDKEAVGRFVREARAASGVGNPHIVDVSDFGELKDGSTYFVMEFLDGPTLGDMLDEHEVLPIELIYDVTLQLCDGLAAAHAQEVVHRDLKPDNITLITHGDRENFCKILDFGIAKVSTNTSKLTKAGSVFGTPHYMSPEQAAGAALDHRTDIYSLGVMLYEMVSGELPFNADNFMGILTQHMYKAPVPIRVMAQSPDCPAALEAIILKCLSKKPEARYQSMAELAADVQRAQDGKAPEAIAEMTERSDSFNVPADYFQADSQSARSSRKRRRPGPRIALYVGVSAALMLVAAVFVMYATTSANTALNRRAAGSAKLSPPSQAPTISSAELANQAPIEPTAKTTKVLLHSVPANATAIIDGKRIQLPHSLTVAEGTTLRVKVEHAGHEGQTVELDGQNEKVEITLKKSVTSSKPNRWPLKPSPRKPANAPPAHGEVVEPWPR